MGSKKFDVEYYINNFSGRIDSACQFEAQKTGLHFGVFRKEAISLARKKAEEYDDQFGTAGFNKWFISIAHQAAAHLVMNKDVYEKLLSESKANKNGHVSIDTPPVLVDSTDVTTMISLTPASTKTKCCGWCKLDKPVEEFYKASASKDGLSNICKECHNGKYGGKKNGSEPKPKTVVFNTKSAASFDDSELGMMIEMADIKIEEAQKVVEAAKAELDKLMVLREKLLKRVKGNGN